MIKTFRGLLADGGQDHIRLQTIKGKVGYRIAKFQIMPNNPGGTNPESVVMIWKEEQTSIIDTVDFTDASLLGVGYWSAPAVGAVVIDTEVIFDSEIFNQDIFVTHKDHNASVDCNYYIELEVIPLDDAGAEYTTLKDMRST